MTGVTPKAATGATMAENKPVARNAAGMTPAEARAWETKRIAAQDVVSGQATIGVGARGTRPSPLWVEQVCRGQFDSVKPRAVQLGSMPAPMQEASATRTFPVSTAQAGGSPGAAYDAGIIALDSALAPVVMSVEGFPVACVLEYGHGAAGSRVMFDWVPGVYNLPPCSYVNVSVLPWGPLFASNWVQTFFGAAILPGNQEGAFPPTVTGRYGLSVGQYIFIPKPDHARGFDVSQLLTDGTPPYGALNVTIGAQGTRDFTNGVLAPGWTPLDVDPAQPNVRVTCTSVGAGALVTFLARWFLQL